jgi:CHAT domain-containing protein/tetratricopeptide (TPR) repeat protein
MNNEPNSDRRQDTTPVDPGEALAQAFEGLVAGRLFSPGKVPEGTERSLIAERDEACPDPGEWLRMVCGEVSPADLDQLLAHAAGCRSCAVRLQQSLKAISAEVTDAELAEVRTFVPDAPERQLEVAEKLAGTPRGPKKPKRGKIYLWAGLSLAASLLLAAGFTQRWMQLHAPERLLAQAYTHSRIFDLRMRGAEFAAVAPGTHLRGGGEGHEDSALLDARARISKELDRTPDSPHWLELQAKTEVLEEKFDPAIDILDRLLAAGPVTSDLLLDAADAYFERGSFSGSENDRATALEYLRRADELAPNDPLVLFNEAIVMEDRGQVTNAVETWNRYLRVESDPHWLAEGRTRLQALQQKLSQLKSHQGRMERRLASPPEMRALAADGAALTAVDEELSSTLLPRLLDAAYPLPVNRSRGSPCSEDCLAARVLLRSLAASLERNHQDPWLTQFLPSDSPSSLQNNEFLAGAHGLSEAIHADSSGDYAAAQEWAAKSRTEFLKIGWKAGVARAEAERTYALQRSSRMADCFEASGKLLRDFPQFPSIEIQGLTEEAVCDTGPGADSKESPSAVQAENLSREHHYVLLDMRARNILGGAAVESGDTEDAWRIYLGTLRMFFAGDYPAFRVYTTLAGLAEVEKSTPRVHVSLLLQREAMGALELTDSRELIPLQRFDLALAAIRAGSAKEARAELHKVQNELSWGDKGKPFLGYLADSEIAMAQLYLGGGDLTEASEMLDSAQRHMAGVDKNFDQREYAATRGELELALGRPERAEAMLRDAILDEERKARGVGASNIIFARQDRDLYAVLAGIWLAERRPSEDVLALWERYRLRILGQSLAPCAGVALDCLKPQLASVVQQFGPDHAFGQIVLPDRFFRYEVTSGGVVWTTVKIGDRELLALAEQLERASSSPRTSQTSVDQLARRAGDLLLGDPHDSPSGSGHLILESDPLLGNLPWPAVESKSGPLGLRFDLEETPSLLLVPRPVSPRGAGHSLIVGASASAEESDPLPEVLVEAQAVARFSHNPSLLIGNDATEAKVIERIGTATTIHFAGHAAQQDGATRLLLAPTSAIAGAGETAYLDSDLLRRHPPRAVRLAVLSACSTGRREEGWNHSMGDIVDTLASLNVPNVVATRWEIDSASAVPLMTAFYSGLAEGLTVPQALSAARRSLVQDVRYRHPYYWAASYASGWGRSDLRDVIHAD